MAFATYIASPLYVIVSSPVWALAIEDLVIEAEAWLLLLILLIATIEHIKEAAITLKVTVFFRFKCCLKYEEEVYTEKLKRLPNIGAIVKTADGEGEVSMVETLKEKIKVRFKDGDDIFYKKYDAKDIVVIKDAEKQEDNIEVESEEDLKELEKLEKLDKLEKDTEDTI